MKQFLVNIFIFFLIIGIIDLCVGFSGDYFQSHPKDNSTRVLNDLLEKDCHDVLVLGSSRALHHFDSPFLCDTLGLDVYNAGYQGNGVVLAYGLLEMILERYHPKLVLFDVEPSFDIYVYEPDNHHKRYISRLKPYYRNDAIGNLIKDVSYEEWIKVHSGLLRYNTKFVSLLLDVIKRKSSPPSGFEPLYGVYTKEPKKNPKEEREIDLFKLKYVEKLIELTNTHRVPLAVVGSPKYGAESTSDLQPVIQICNKYNVPFLNYYSDVVFNQHKEWFKDAMHLNAVGARVFSAKIAGEINRLISTDDKSADCIISSTNYTY